MPREHAFRQFNGALVILAPGLRAVYQPDQNAKATVETELLVSNFQLRGDLAKCTLRWQLLNASDSSALSEMQAGSIAVDHVPAGRPVKVGALRASVDGSLSAPLRLNVTTVLTCDGALPSHVDASRLSQRDGQATWANSWVAWLFPSLSALPYQYQASSAARGSGPQERSLFVDDFLLRAPAIKALFPDARALPAMASGAAQGVDESAAVFILSPPGVANATEARMRSLLNAAASGATLVLLQPPNTTTGLPPQGEPFSFHDSIAGSGGFVGHVVSPTILSTQLYYRFVCAVPACRSCAARRRLRCTRSCARWRRARRASPTPAGRRF